MQNIFVLIGLEVVVVVGSESLLFLNQLVGSVMVKNQKCCFTFAQHYKVTCNFGTLFFCAVLVAQGIRDLVFKHA